MDICNDCKYYFRDENYCTHLFYKEFSPDSEACDEFKRGVFNERFYIKAVPLGISTGDYYVLVDRDYELVDYYGDFLDFKYVDEAETLCEFLNNQNHRLHHLQLWVNEVYYVNPIELNYWSKRDEDKPIPK